MLRIKKILLAALVAYLSLHAVSSLCEKTTGNYPSGLSISGDLVAQESKAPVAQSSKETNMAESPGAIYIVMSVVLIIWIGLALFIFSLDRKVAAIEKNLDS